MNCEATGLRFSICPTDCHLSHRFTGEKSSRSHPTYSGFCKESSPVPASIRIKQVLGARRCGNDSQNSTKAPKKRGGLAADEKNKAITRERRKSFVNSSILHSLKASVVNGGRETRATSVSRAKIEDALCTTQMIYTLSTSLPTVEPYHHAILGFSATYPPL